jgi:hypothetical protein
MAGIPLFLLLLTAREVQLSTESPILCHAPRLLRCRHFVRCCAFVCANYKTGGVFVVKTGAYAVVLDWR